MTQIHENRFNGLRGGVIERVEVISSIRSFRGRKSVTLRARFYATPEQTVKTVDGYLVNVTPELKLGVNERVGQEF